MINTEIIEEAIELALYSTAIKDERPVSLLLIAPAEHGKTDILKKFKNIPVISFTTEFNSFTFSDFAVEFQTGTKKTIMIPDFLRIVMKKYSTQGTALTIINAVTEEGWSGKLPMGQVINKTIQANLITSLTQDTLMDKRRRWSSIGFLSRFIPLTYSYDDSTKQQIREFIKGRVYHKDREYDFDIPEKKVDIKLPKEMANNIERITMGIRLETEKNLTGFRLQKQLQTLAMASALKNRRDIVVDSDIDTIKKISEHINFDFKKI